MAKHERTYTREFKVEAVKLDHRAGQDPSPRPPATSASARACSAAGRQALAAEGDQAFPGQGNLPAVEEELRRLRAENKRLRMERDILKKATAFFAREAS